MESRMELGSAPRSLWAFHLWRELMRSLDGSHEQTPRGGARKRRWTPAILEPRRRLQFSSRKRTQDGQPIAAPAPRFSPTRIYAACSAASRRTSIASIEAEHAA